MNKSIFDWAGMLLLPILLFGLPQLANSQCTLICSPPSAQVSVDANCFAEIVPADVLTNLETTNCVGGFTVELSNAFGNLPNSPFVGAEEVGQTLNVLILNVASGNSCETTVQVSDYLAPSISCGNLSITCSESIAPEAIGFAVASDNCDPNPLLSFTDLMSNEICNPDFVQQITRTWTATDASGNAAIPCVQTITLQRPDLSAIQFPENRDDVEAPSISCTNAIIIPDSAGYPSLNGSPISNGDACELWVTFQDADPLEFCSGSYTVLRTWTVSDECSNASESETQVIKVKDSEGPIINCPNDIFVSNISSTTCAGSVIIPNASATQSCGSDSDISIIIKNESNNIVGANTAVFLPVGIHVFTYEATDDCGNTSTCSINVTLDDGVNPVVSCNSFTTIGLGNSSITNISASNFDDGSYDNCGAVSFLARRMDNPDCPGIDASVFASQVPFYCCDIGTTVMVELMVTDAADRQSNSCMVEVTVQDNLDPQIICPPDTMLECTHYFLEPTVTGEPIGIDNCGIANFSFLDVEDLSICNTGTVQRTWTVVDDQGQETFCEQLITLIDTTTAIINFPPDVENGTCGDADDLSISGEPAFEDNCSLFAVNKDDTVIEFEDGCLRKIIRIWTVWDWCKDIMYTDVQVIKEFDNEAPVFDVIPPDLTVECDLIPPVANVQATDVCQNDVNLEFDELITDGDCADEYLITRRWIASDNCENADTLIQLINVSDTTPPQLFGDAPDLTINCNEPVPLSTLTATDNCDTDVDLQMTEVRIDGDCPNEFMLVRTWTATDNCGNSSERIQNISVQDEVAPVLSDMPDDLTVECDGIPAPENIFGLDNCDDNIEVIFSEVRTDGSCAFEFTLSRTWTATDACGNETTHTQLIQVDDTMAPTLSGMPDDVTVNCGEIPEIAELAANDNCDPNVNVVFSESTQSGDCAEDIIITRTWTATDACGNSTSTQQVITSMDNEGPVLTGVPDDITVQCGEIPNAPEVIATDNCAANIVVEFSEDSVFGNCLEDVVITRTWTATDNCGNSTSAQQVISSRDSEEPILTGVPDDVTVQCGEIPNAPEVIATDNCAANIVVEFTENSVIDDCSEDVIITRTWTATDNCGNSTSAQQVISSSDNEAPVLIGLPDDEVVQCGVLPDAPMVTATDNCAANIVVEFTETSETGDCLEDVVITRTWTATDNCGNTTSAQQVISSGDGGAPVLVGVPNDITVECGIIPEVPSVTATDDCTENIIVEFTETSVAGNCLEEVVVTRTWTATDNCGNSTSAQQVISSRDTEVPVLIGVPDDMTVQCDAIPVSPTVTATDNCDTDVTVVFDQMIMGGDCENTFMIIWTWTATDNCGNLSSDETTINIIDDMAPVINGVPADVTLECSEVPEVPSLTATDNCDVNPVITFVEVSDGSSCGEFTVTRTWTATDDCGNQSSASQVLTLTDGSAPTFVDTPDDITVECDNVPAPAVLAIVDDCGNDTDLQFSEVRENGDCANNYELVRTWTASDSCGNSETFVQVVTVEDTTPPMIECPVIDVLEIMLPGICEVEVTLTPTIMDNCDPIVNVSYEIDFENTMTIDTTGGFGDAPFVVQSYPIGSSTVNFTVEDDCGNTASCSTEVIVVDEAVPSFECVSPTVVLSELDSTGFVEPTQFLTNVFTECCLDFLTISRFSPPFTEEDTLFLDYDDYLESINSPNGGITVIVYAYDCYGNRAGCITEFNVVLSEPPMVAISGGINTEENEVIPEVEVMLDGGMMDMAMTDENGAFEFSEVPQGYNYWVSPESNNEPLNGVSTWDIILLQKHILGIETLDSPYKMIAGDVNQSGHISTFDLIELRQLILGITTEFPNNNSWRFVDADFVFPNPANPFESSFPEVCTVNGLGEGIEDMSFIGVKIGDLNGSVETNFAMGGGDDRSFRTIYFETEDQVLKEGEIIEVPVFGKDIDEVLGFQFSMTFDVAQLEFVGVEKYWLSDFGIENFGLTNKSNGELRCSWQTAEGLSFRSEEKLFALKFKVKSSGFLSASLDLNSDFTPAEIYQNGMPHSFLSLQFKEFENEELSFELFQNRPNPFRSQTEIGFNLEEESMIDFAIFDASGKVVFQKQGWYSLGYHQIGIEEENLNGTGVYFYCLRTKDGGKYKKMILQR